MATILDLNALDAAVTAANVALNAAIETARAGGLLVDIKLSYAQTSIMPATAATGVTIVSSINLPIM